MDPISDLLTRIRNSNSRQKDRVDVPYSKLKLEIIRILKEEGFIANFKTLFNPGAKSGTVRVFLKYSPTKEAVIRGIKRVSKPGLRVYRGYGDIPRSRDGFAVTILSTPQGVVTHKQAREKKVGGEILCQVW
ncbi:MAG: 30S ribosomal protein S8 [Elusimicrobia bacterium]|nr:30S ribosomal protein S8 [Elusimicrobiota bacterium]MDE2236413.1 30S ribosomal protein S8 [Elusimicrobiota bacterium]MDE2425324.1 30S ribosomal protein S8 [Elusimicrobiota bacterium]